jgi:hypothetical protein
VICFSEKLVVGFFNAHFLFWFCSANKPFRRLITSILVSVLWGYEGVGIQHTSSFCCPENLQLKIFTCCVFSGCILWGSFCGCL